MKFGLFSARLANLILIFANCTSALLFDNVLDVVCVATFCNSKDKTEKKESSASVFTNSGYRSSSMVECIVISFVLT